MKKVVYGVSRYVKGEISKITGIGYITDYIHHCNYVIIYNNSFFTFTYINTYLIYVVVYHFQYVR